MAIHQLPQPQPGTIRPYARYKQRSFDPPRWATDRRTWEQAVEIFHGQTPPGAECFIHRDFHPGNLLWQRSHLSGVVDWESASLGPVHVDLGHCRLNFFYGTSALADLLVRVWEQITGGTYNPWADIAAIIGVLDDLRTTPRPPSTRKALEHALAAPSATWLPADRARSDLTPQRPGPMQAVTGRSAWCQGSRAPLPAVAWRPEGRRSRG